MVGSFLVFLFDHFLRSKFTETKRVKLSIFFFVNTSIKDNPIADWNNTKRNYYKFPKSN